MLAMISVKPSHLFASLLFSGELANLEPITSSNEYRTSWASLGHASSFTSQRCEQFKDFKE